MEEQKGVSYAKLNQLYLRRKDTFNRHFDSRMRRALSWLKRAEQDTNDPHAGFIFYWISLSAGYSPDFEGIGTKEAALQYKYFSMITACDSQSLISDLVWQKRQVEIKRLLKNKFIYRPFWETPDPVTDVSWKSSFREQGRQIDTAFENQNTAKVLRILFGRLYVLRNQLVHGNATWNGRRNRPQVEDGHKIISKLQPLFLLMMLNNPTLNWGKVSFDLYAEGFDDY